MFKHILSWILIFQLVASSAAANVGLLPAEGQATSVAPAVSTAPAISSTPAFDADLLTRQYRRTYKKVRNQDGSTQWAFDQELLLSQPDIQIPYTTIANIDGQIRIRIDQQNHELIFERFYIDHNTNEAQVTDAHVFKNIEIIGDVIADENFIAFITAKDGKAEGVRFILTKQLKEHGFLAPLPAFLSVPLHLPSDQVQKVEFLSRFSEPRTLTDFSAKQTLSSARGGDLCITVKNQEGISENLWVDRATILMNVRIRLLHLMLLMQTANPDFDHLQALQKVFEENAHDFKVVEKSAEDLLAIPEADPTRLAISALAQRSGATFIASLFDQQKYKGQDAFQFLSVVPRDRFSADPDPEGLWKQASHQAFEHMKKLSEQQRGLATRFMKRIDRLAQKIISQRNLIILGGVLAGIFSAQLGTDGKFLATLTQYASQVINWTLHSSLIEPVYEGIQSLKEAHRFKLWAFGSSIFLGLYGMAHLASYAWAYVDSLRGKSSRMPFQWQAMAKGFMTRCTNFYGWVNRSFQEFFYWIFRQRNVYPAVDANVDILNTPDVFNSPFITKENLKNNAQKINQHISDQATQKAIAQKLAAVLVVSELKKIDPATLILSESQSTSALLEVLSQKETAKKWIDLTEKIYESIRENLAQFDFNESEFRQNVQYYLDLATKLQQQSSGGLKTRFSQLYFRAKRFMKKKVLPFLLFGKDGRRLFFKLKDVTLDPTTVRISRSMNEFEYHASVSYYALIAAKDFAWPTHPRIWVDQLGSLTIYGGQVPADVVTTVDEEPLANPYPPLSVPIEERKQSFFEGLKIIGSETVNPDSVGILATHAQYIENLKDGLQARFLLGAIPLSIGYAVTDTHRSAILAMLFILALKLGFQVNNGKFLLGYAVPWPIVNRLLLYLKEASTQNTEQLLKAVSLLDEGIRFQEDGKLFEGVYLVQELYGDRAKLPIELQLAPCSYSYELAKKLLEHVQMHPPVATEMSRSMDLFLNLAGTIVATYLGNQVSKELFSPNGNTLLDLAQAAGWLVATYVGLKLTTRYITTPLLRGIKKLVSYPKKAFQHCASHLVAAGGDKQKAGAH